MYDPGLSDHPLVYSFMRNKAAKVKPRIIKFRSVKNFDEEKFQEHLKSAPWHVGEVFDSVEDRVGFVSTLLTEIVNDHMPFKQMRVRDQDVPYMNSEWKGAIRARRRAARRYRRTNAPEDLINLKKFRNEATRLRRKAIKSYWKKKLRISRINHKTFIKPLCPSYHQSQNAGKSQTLRLTLMGRLVATRLTSLRLLGSILQQLLMVLANWT